MILSFHLGPYAIKLLYCSLFYDQNVLNVWYLALSTVSYLHLEIGKNPGRREATL